MLKKSVRSEKMRTISVFPDDTLENFVTQLRSFGEPSSRDHLRFFQQATPETMHDFHGLFHTAVPTTSSEVYEIRHFPPLAQLLREKRFSVIIGDFVPYNTPIHEPFHFDNPLTGEPLPLGKSLQEELYERMMRLQKK